MPRMIKQYYEDFMCPVEVPRQKSFPAFFVNARSDKMNGPGREHIRRDPRLINTICIHQTGIEYGVSKRQINAIPSYMPNPERHALHRRFWKVPYHVVALRTGDLLWNNDVYRYTYHGNSVNSYSLGYAVEGNYPGSTLDRFMIKTAQAGLRLAVEKGRKDGCNIEYITSHRQYNKKRAGDPGERIWKTIVMPMLKPLDLRVNYEVNKGLSIPINWERGPYYGG